MTPFTHPTVDTMPPARRRALYAITRDRKAKNAWYWRVTFRRRGKRYCRTFYDLKRGGSKQSLAAAIAWRDRQLKQAGVL